MDEPKIPTVEEAQAKVDALEHELAALTLETTALEARLKAVTERRNAIQQAWQPTWGLLPRARAVRERAAAAEIWDQSRVVKMELRSYAGAPPIQVEGRLLKVTEKQIHVYTERGSLSVKAFSRSDGMYRDGRTRILNLSEVLATVAQS